MRIPNVPPGDKAYVGWFAIAKFLEVSVDTAQRWEKPETMPWWAAYPMPTHETAGTRWILQSEVDLWLSQHTMPGLVAGRLRSLAVNCGDDAGNRQRRRTQKV